MSGPPAHLPTGTPAGSTVTQPDTRGDRWPVCARAGDLLGLTPVGQNTYGACGGEILIIAGRTGKRQYLELDGGGYRTECCPKRGEQPCDCVEKFLYLDLVAYFTAHLADFHEHWLAWRAQQWGGDTDEWFAQDGVCATVPSTYPGDIALICYAGQWLWARVHRDLMCAHGGGPDDYRVTFGWEAQLLNTVWPKVTGFTPPERPAPHAAPAGTLTAAAGT